MTGWVRRWDAQQEVYVRDRERRFEVMAEFVAAMAAPDATVLDLAAGPGSAGLALLDRLPGLSVLALDTDPVLLELGRAAHGDRLAWARADLRDPGWVDALDREVHVVVSTTALHWLPPPDLARLHRQLAELLPPGGLFVNGDLLPIPAGAARIRGAVAAIEERRERTALDGGAESWSGWWEAVRADPDLAPLAAERARLWPTPARHEAVGLAFHETSLAEAGFDEVAVVWQDLQERVLVALTPR